MNKKTEDQLVRLAFGDLTPEEAARLQNETARQPEAAQTLDTYRRMKEELRSLAEVPADQLSKERLREAILARGLSERPAPRQASWLWMPAAAAVLAFAIVFARGHNGRTNAPVAVLGGDSHSGMVATNLPNFKPKLPSSVKTNTPVATDEDILDAFGDQPGPTETHRSRHKVRNDDTPWMDVSDYDIYSGNRGRASAPAGPSTVGPTPSAVTPVEPSTVADMQTHPAFDKSEKKTDPIILIQPETDNNTGARKATEVESASNVLVGG